MDTATIFGTGRSSADMRGVFAPAGTTPGPTERGSVLSTFKGFGAEGKGRDQVLGLFERFNMISAEQRAAGGAVAEAADGAASVASVAERFTATSPAASAAGAGTAAAARSSNPVYGGLYAQMLIREQGLQVPLARAEQLADEAIDAIAGGGAAAAADDVAAAVDTPLAAVADDAAARVAGLERQLIESFQRLGSMPVEQRIPALTAAIDASAAAGHGDDAFGVLAGALSRRPIEGSITALDDAVTAFAKQAAPIVDDAAKLAPVVDDVAKLASVADDVLRSALPGAMGMSAGIDDTLRLLALIR